MIRGSTRGNPGTAVVFKSGSHLDFLVRLPVGMYPSNNIITIVMMKVIENIILAIVVHNIVSFCTFVFQKLTTNIFKHQIGTSYEIRIKMIPWIRQMLVRDGDITI